MVSMVRLKIQLTSIVGEESGSSPKGSGSRLLEDLQ